jgi:hypothetical protein
LAECWWCQYDTSPRHGRSFKNCPQWRRQQKILWAVVSKETGRGKDRFKFRDLFADEHCSRAIVNFLSTTDVGRRVGPDRAEEDAQSEASEGEVREQEEKAELHRQEAQRLEAGDLQQERDR